MTTSSPGSVRPTSPPPAVVVGLDNITGLQTARILAARGVPVFGIVADRVARLAESTDQLVQDEARPAAQDLRRSIASIERTTANLDTLLGEARPGVQNLTKSTLPEVNRLVRDLRELTSSLESVSSRLEQGGVTGILGAPKLPDHNPGKSR